jgi:hypothetical protein
MSAFHPGADMAYPQSQVSFVPARSGRSIIRGLDQRHVLRPALDKRYDIAVSGPADQIASNGPAQHDLQ